MSVTGAGRAQQLDRLFAGGLAWSAGAKAATQILSWASVVVAARLLSPSDFGIAGMAGVFFGITNVLAEFGIGAAVLQMHELERDVIGQMHPFACTLCTGIFIMSELASPAIAAFFRSERLIPVLLVNNLVFFITGFQQVPSALLQRDMDYRRLSLLEATMALVQSIVTIAAALAGLKYWSLVISVVLAKTTAAVLNYYWQPVPFRWPRWREIRPALHMGGQIAIARLAWSAYTQSDGIVVGRNLGGAQLGAYQMAMTLASAPADKICTLIMRVSGPLFAKIQTDRALVKRYFLIILQGIALAVLPVMLGFAVAAPDAIAAVLGDKWKPAAAPLTWLCLFVSLRSVSALADQVLVSLRRTGFNMVMSLINLAVMPLSFVIASERGVAAVAACWLLLAPITVFPGLFQMMRTATISLRDTLIALAPALAGSAALLLAVIFVRQSVPASPIARLAAEIAAGAGAYAFVLLAFFRKTIIRYVRFIRSLGQADL